jgi:hypothetical protein
MEETKAVESLLQWPADLLDRVVALLSKVGIDLAPLWLQLFLLVIVLALLVPVIRRVRARRKKDRLPLWPAGCTCPGVVIDRMNQPRRGASAGHAFELPRRPALSRCWTFAT